MQTERRTDSERAQGLLTMACLQDLTPERGRWGEAADVLQHIPVGIEPGPIAFSPNNGTVFVVNEGSGDVTPLMT